LPTWMVGPRGRTGTYHADPDATYVRVIEIDASRIEPQVSFPHLPENVRPVSQVGDVRIDQAVIGLLHQRPFWKTCVLPPDCCRGSKSIPMCVVSCFPGSQQVYLDALREGIVELIVEAGAAVSTPTCGPCLGGHMGVLASGERAVGTTNRNFRGRMGHPDSEVYLAGPAVAAASAIAGRIVGPQEVVA